MKHGFRHSNGRNIQKHSHPFPYKMPLTSSIITSGKVPGFWPLIYFKGLLDKETSYMLENLEYRQHLTQQIHNPHTQSKFLLENTILLLKNSLKSG